MGSRVGIILLAAGGSSRMGRPKQLLPVEGTSLVRRLAAEAARSSAHRVTVVVGADRDAVIGALDGLDVDVIVNDRWPKGLSSSIRTGVRAAAHASDGLILMLADMPRVTAEHLDALMRTQTETDAGIVASRDGDIVGVPALFMKRFVAGLLALGGDRGAQELIRQNASGLRTVDLPGGLIDIDTPDDARSHLGDV